jgi:hypothetical protein
MILCTDAGKGSIKDGVNGMTLTNMPQKWHNICYVELKYSKLVIKSVTLLFKETANYLPKNPEICDVH